MGNVALCFQLNSAQQGLLWSEAHKSLLLLSHIHVTHPLGIAVGHPPSGCPFRHVSLMDEVEDSRLSQLYAEHMEAPGIGFTVCPFKCCVWTSSGWHVLLLQLSSCPVPVALSACERHIPEQSWGTHRAQGCG